MKRELIVALVILLSAPYAGAKEKIRVFVSIPPQKQFVEKIAGDLVDVRVMLVPGASPETYSPSPKMLVALAGARLYFQAGVPFEKRWTESIRAVNRNIRIVTCCGHINGDHAQAVAIHDHHDLHIWSSPANVMLLAGDILEALSEIDPVHAEQYVKNHDQFIGELKELDDQIRKKLAGRRTDYFIVSHAAWGYLADQYGLVQVALEHNNRESGPRALSGIIDLARNEDIHILFVQEQYKTSTSLSLARELNAAIIELDPLAEDYMAGMRYTADRLAEALR